MPETRKLKSGRKKASEVNHNHKNGRRGKTLTEYFMAAAFGAVIAGSSLATYKIMEHKAAKEEYETKRSEAYKMSLQAPYTVIINREEDTGLVTSPVKSHYIAHNYELMVTSCTRDGSQMTSHLKLTANDKIYFPVSENEPDDYRREMVKSKFRSNILVTIAVNAYRIAEAQHTIDVSNMGADTENTNTYIGEVFRKNLADSPKLGVKQSSLDSYDLKIETMDSGHNCQLEIGFRPF